MLVCAHQIGVNCPVSIQAFVFLLVLDLNSEPNSMQSFAITCWSLPLVSLGSNQILQEQ